MQVLIIYDSLFGNTEKIAQAVGSVFESGKLRVLRATDADAADLAGADLLIVGSPTHGGRPSAATQQFLQQIPAGALRNVRGAAFDTSTPTQGQSGFVRFLVRFIGYAAGKISKALAQKGAQIIGVESFYVLGKEGPLKSGEVERAKQWTEELLVIMSPSVV